MLLPWNCSQQVFLNNSLFVSKLFRVRIGKGPAVRDLNPNRKTALELSVRTYAEKRNGMVVNPTVGASFDSIDEAYELYNLYSWECGFGIRWGKKRWSEKKQRRNRSDEMHYQLGQEFYCSCRVRICH